MRRKDVCPGDRYWANLARPHRSPECVEVEVIEYAADRGRWVCHRLDTGGMVYLTTSKFRVDPAVGVVGGVVGAEDPKVTIGIRVHPDLRDRLYEIPNWPDVVRAALLELVAQQV